MPIRVFIADDHGIVRDGLRSILRFQPDMLVVGEAGNGLDCLRRLPESRPDVLIIDVAMPGMNGIDTAQQLREILPALRTIILSMHVTGVHVRRALKAGACGYLVKECAGAEVVQAVRAVHAGRRFFSERIADLVAQEGLLHPGRFDHDPLDLISPRERQVLQLVVEGKTSDEISVLLSLSPKTVETYRSRLREILHLDSTSALVKFALAHGLTAAE
jgi:two-component system, NarL family, response regulator NreC